MRPSPNSPSIRPLLAVVALVASIGLLASCSSKGSKELKAADLKGALPTSVGAGYKKKSEDVSDKVVTKKSKSDKETEKAMEKACPEAAKLSQSDDETPSQVSREFETENGRGITVTIDPHSNAPSEDKLDAMIKAVNACKTIKTVTDGTPIEMKVSAEREDSYGDYGVRFHIEGKVTVSGIDIPLTLEGVEFAVGDLEGEVEVSSGVDPTTYEGVPADTDKIDAIATKLASDLESL